MRLFIHIGAPKTGTTLLQRWLYANRETLSASGVFLSQSGGQPNNIFFPGLYSKALLSFLPQFYGIKSDAEKREFFRDFLPRFSKEIERASDSHRTVVITSEQLFRLSRDEAQEFVSFLKTLFSEIVIICYFREPISHAVSMTNEVIRGPGNYRDLASYVRRQLTNDNYDYQGVVDIWASLVGNDRFSARLFDPDFFSQGDIRRDFLSVVAPEVPNDGLDWSMSTANESMSALQAAALQGLNQVLPFWEPGGGPNKLRGDLSKEIQQSEVLRRGKVAFSPNPEDIKRSRELTKNFLVNSFEKGTVFRDYSPPPGNETIPLEQAQAAVLEAIKIGLGRGRLVTDEQVDLLNAVVHALSRRKRVEANQIEDLKKLCLQLSSES